MGFYHQEKNVGDYIRMAKGYDGKEIILEFKGYLPLGSSVLEIGMGPGSDLTIMENFFKVTGSDFSEIFIDRYRKHHPSLDLMLLDAVTLETERKFNGIYSNKVLIHLTRDELEQSIRSQENVLDEGGIICHSFWYGDREEDYDGLRFIYYNENHLQNFFNRFDILKIEQYREMESKDSIFIIARKR
ncbi:MAG: class I SAM-dependent methyltransferase [Promethearchaeota archaeon]